MLICKPVSRFACPVEACGQVLGTKSELKFHQKDIHLIGLPAKCVTHVCEWCDYSFPTKSRLKKHVVLCQRGTSRTGFRKQISDVLQWLGKGAYKCTFCEAEFHPEPDNVTRKVCVSYLTYRLVFSINMSYVGTYLFNLLKWF